MAFVFDPAARPFGSLQNNKLDGALSIRNLQSLPSLSVSFRRHAQVTGELSHPHALLRSQISLEGSFLHLVQLCVMNGLRPSL